MAAETIEVTEELNLECGLSLVPRLKLLFSFTRSDISSTKAIDEWQLKMSLLNYVRETLSIALSDEHLVIEKFKDLKKRKRFEPVASGTLFLWDLSSVKREMREDRRSLQERYDEWKIFVVGKMDGFELNVEGLILKVSAWLPAEDDFSQMEAAWKDFFAARGLGLGAHSNPSLQIHWGLYYQFWMRIRGSCSIGLNLDQKSIDTNYFFWTDISGYGSRNMVQPDTLILEGVPSRWFAEPRVSSKVSVLVTHTIFSKFGKIRNLDFVGNNDLGKAVQDVSRDITSALHCKVWVQYERYSSFFNAVKAFCGRSMQKEGSRLKANYRIDWDKDGHFTEINVRRRVHENKMQADMEHRQLLGRPFQSDLGVPKAQFLTSARHGQSSENFTSRGKRRNQEAWKFQDTNK